MSASGFTPIQLYRTSTAAATPSAGNLADGELAINLTDEKLYFKNASGVVKLLASNSGSLGSVTSVNASGSTTGLTFTGGPITSSGTLTLGGTLGVANGGTGTSTQFTAGSVVFAGASGVYTQDNAQLFWDNANDRLGIGTATPSAKLSVVGTAKIGEGAASNSAKLMVNTVSGAAAGIQLFQDGNESWVIENPASTTALTFANSGTERMRITGAGLVGIGTSSPGAKLSVATNTATAGMEESFSVTNTVDSNVFIRVSGTANSDKKATIGPSTSTALVFNTTDTERMRITGAGDVLVGKTAASVGADGVQLLAAGYSGFSAAGTTALFLNRNTNDGTILEFGRNGVAAAAMGLTSSALTFGTAGSERMRLDASGNLGIGTTSPLSVSGYKTLTLNDASGGAVAFNVNGTIAGSIASFSNDMYYDVVDATVFRNGAAFNGTPTERMRLDGSGNLGIGTTSPTAVWGTTVQIGNGTGNGTFSIVGNGGSGFMAMAGSNFQLIARGSTPLQFGSNDVVQMTLGTGGHLGIGTTTPAYALDVSANGNISGQFKTSGSINALYLADAGTTAGSLYIGTVGNDFRVVTGSNEQMRVTSAGNVGIGTTSPNAQLHVSFSPPVSVPALGSGAGALALGPAANYGMLLGSVSDGSGYIQQQRFDSTSTVYPLALQPNGGNVGIGTTAPGSKLTINDPGTGMAFTNAASGNFNIGLLAGTGSALAYVYQRANSDLLFGTNNTERMRIDATGNVGIGTSSPTAYSGYTSLEIDNASNGGILSIKKAGSVVGYLNGASGLLLLAQSNDLKLTTTGSTSMQFSTNATERMRIDSSGNVSVGTATALGTTSGRGNITVNGTSSILSFGISGSLAGYVLHDGTDLWVNNTLAGAQRFYTNGDERMRIDSSGRILLGQTANANSFRLQIVGSGGAAGDVGIDSNASYGEIQSFNSKPLYINRQGNDVILNATSGSVGIGTTSPGAKLDVNGQSNFRSAINLLTGSQAYFYNPAGNAFGYIAMDASNILQVFNNAGSAIALSTNATERMRIDASGNVGIGTSSPTSFGAGATMLTVAGTSAYGGYLGATTTVTVQLWANEGGLEGTVGTRTNHPLTFTTNNTERMRITADGNLQLGTASLATNATNGFPYIPTCAGTPTGTPTAITGYAPMVVDSTNNKLYVYVGGAWQAMN